ncbi:MAG: MBL fold metallo-hydrolase [Nibricoccus sp.]
MAIPRTKADFRARIVRWVVGLGLIAGSIFLMHHASSEGRARPGDSASTVRVAVPRHASAWSQQLAALRTLLAPEISPAKGERVQEPVPRVSFEEVSVTEVRRRVFSPGVTTLAVRSPNNELRDAVSFASATDGAAKKQEPADRAFVVLNPLALVLPLSVQPVGSASSGLAPVLSAAISASISTAIPGTAVASSDAVVQLPTVWTMINVSPRVGQADCHLVQFPTGKNVLIDAGEGWDAHGAALGYLQSAAITHLDLVVLTHMHWDHYGKLIEIINAGIKVDRVALSLPASREIADAEIPWGCDWDDVQRLLQFLRERQIPYWTPKSGETLMEATQGAVKTTIEVLCLFDGINTPVGATDVNDTSMVLRLAHGSIRALFTGDLNNPLGAWMATSELDLKADLLKVPHHGTEGLAPNSFFDRVGAKAVFVPSPLALWFSDRSGRAREYFAQRGVPAYVSGLDGNVTVRIDVDSYSVTSDRRDLRDRRRLWRRREHTQTPNSSHEAPPLVE